MLFYFVCTLPHSHLISFYRLVVQNWRDLHVNLCGSLLAPDGDARGICFKLIKPHSLSKMFSSPSVQQDFYDLDTAINL